MGGTTTFIVLINYLKDFKKSHNQTKRNSVSNDMHASAGNEEAVGTTDHSGNPSDTSGDEAAGTLPRKEDEFEDERHVEGRWSGGVLD